MNRQESIASIEQAEAAVRELASTLPGATVKVVRELFATTVSITLPLPPKHSDDDIERSRNEMQSRMDAAHDWKAVR